MDKIETLREIEIELCKEMFADSPDVSVVNKRVKRLIEYREAIRADERQKAVGRLKVAACKLCEHYDPCGIMTKSCPEIAVMVAAIMAEPEEAQR